MVAIVVISSVVDATVVGWFVVLVGLAVVGSVVSIPGSMGASGGAETSDKTQ